MTFNNANIVTPMTSSTSPTGVPVTYTLIVPKCGGQMKFKNEDSNGISYSLVMVKGWKLYESVPATESGESSTDKTSKDKNCLVHVEQNSIFAPYIYAINRKSDTNAPSVTAMRCTIKPFNIWTKPYLHFLINGHSFVALKPDSQTTAEVRLLFAPLNERNVWDLVENRDYYVVGRMIATNSCSCCAEKRTGEMQIWENYLSTVATSPAPYAIPAASGSNPWSPLANQPTKFDKM
ncbi:hypothetical protein BKA69DRAFT_1036004 [Paraphysoderma sedebokerense]|nr:hypothetical protein BKA69DRAFT_1036004 [Paraphysoderma sedebokerense]